MEREKSIPHIIIGAGIAGCYIGLQLHNKGEKYLILEKGGKERGKQQTIEWCDGNAELGSSVINSNQPNILRMCDMLNLSTSTLPKDEKSIIFIDGLTPAHLARELGSLEEAKAQFRAAKKKVREASERMSKTMTVEQVAKKVLTEEEFRILEKGWDCWFENNVMNAFTYFTSKEGDYMVINEGMNQLLSRSTKILNISFNTPVFSIEKKEDGFIINQKFKALKLYFTPDLFSALKIKLKNLPNLSSYLRLGNSRACARYYICLNKTIKLPDEKITSIVWGDSYLKWTLRVGDRLWLVSYVDGKLETELKSKKSEVAKDWIQLMNKHFSLNLSVDNIEGEVAAFWEHAYTYLLPEYFSENSKAIKNSLECVCTTLPHPDNQAWIEGHLVNIEV